MRILSAKEAVSVCKAFFNGIRFNSGSSVFICCGRNFRVEIQWVMGTRTRKVYVSRVQERRCRLSTRYSKTFTNKARTSAGYRFSSTSKSSAMRSIRIESASFPSSTSSMSINLQKNSAISSVFPSASFCSIAIEPVLSLGELAPFFD